MAGAAVLGGGYHNATAGARLGANGGRPPGRAPPRVHARAGPAASAGRNRPSPGFQKPLLLKAAGRGTPPARVPRGWAAPLPGVATECLNSQQRRRARMGARAATACVAATKMRFAKGRRAAQGCSNRRGARAARTSGAAAARRRPRARGRRFKAKRGPGALKSVRRRRAAPRRRPARRPPLEAGGAAARAEFHSARPGLAPEPGGRIKRLISRRRRPSPHPPCAPGRRRCRRPRGTPPAAAARRRRARYR